MLAILSAVRHTHDVFRFFCLQDEKRRKKSIRVPTPLQVKPPTPLSEYIRVDPSPKPFPRTTTNEVGWRSSQNELKLERYGKYTRGKANILRTFKWPDEASA